MGNISVLINRIMLTSFVCFLWMGVVEADVYRWYDEQGRTHYTDKANSKGNSVEIKIDKAPKRDKHAEERLKRQKEYVYGKEENKPEATSKAELARQKKEREKNCKQLTINLALLANTPRIFKESEDGTRRFLDDKERAAELKLTNQQISDLCR